MKKPTISLITVCFNADKYIENTLKSIIEQDFDYKEIIVIDGASKDYTLSLINKYSEKINRLVSEPDKGLYDAMNKGLNLASGEYVLFINAGDTFHDNQTLSKCMNQCANADVIYGDTLITDQNWQAKHLRRLRPPQKLKFRSFAKGMLVSHQSFIARRSLVTNYNLNYRYSADFDWCIQILGKSKKNCFYNAPIAHFMDGGQTSKTLIPGLKERFKIMYKHYGLLSTLLNHVFILFRMLWHLIKVKT
jgi:glycosyltransferase involved in cell wall biosynthesis